MLYGNKEVQDEILKQVRNFEEKYHKKVVFGAMVGSISKGVERYDSDYDTRFLYLDQSEQGIIRWDQVDGIKEFQIHQCYIPGDKDCYADGYDYRNRFHEFQLEDKGLFYDKIAFWELTSYINFLRNPMLDDKFSIGLYHIVAWTFNSPFCWDPYGLKSKISSLIDEMYIAKYEIQYYRNYIEKALKRNSVLLREYLYSAYYALAIEYCIQNNRFAPVYFKSLLALCDKEEITMAILDMEKKYYDAIAEKIRQGLTYERKMADYFCVDNNDLIDCFLQDIMVKAERYCNNNVESGKKDYVDAIIDIIIGSLKRPLVRDVND